MIDDSLFLHPVVPNKIGPYLLKEKIGSGAYSEIRVAIDYYTNEKYACKVIPMQKLIASNTEYRIDNEVKIMKTLTHPSIVTLIDVLKDSLNCYIIMELVSHKSLYDRITEIKKFDEQKAKFIFRQILDGIYNMHQNNICHRDIKPENVMIDENDFIKIIDFGLSDYESGPFTNSCGSTAYQSPESFKCDPYDGYKSDVWSLGVLLYTMLFGHLPWTQASKREIINQIINGQFFVPVSVSTDCQNLLYHMLNLDPAKRASLDDVYESKWVKYSGTICRNSMHQLSMNDIFMKKQIHNQMPLTKQNMSVKQLISVARSNSRKTHKNNSCSLCTFANTMNDGGILKFIRSRQ